MADPEEYRTKEQVEEWRKRDPINAFKQRMVDDGMISKDDFKSLDEAAVKRIDEAVEFADGSPFPDLDSLYDDIYVYGDQVKGWYAVDERAPEPHRGEEERQAGDLAHELAEAGAAYAGAEYEQEQGQRHSGDDAGSGLGEAAGEQRDEEGGGD
jgi:hypothetical protein